MVSDEHIRRGPSSRTVGQNSSSGEIVAALIMKGTSQNCFYSNTIFVISQILAN